MQGEVIHRPLLRTLTGQVTVQVFSDSSIFSPEDTCSFPFRAFGPNHEKELASAMLFFHL